MIFEKKFSENNLHELIIEPGVEYENCEFSGINFSDFNFKSTSFSDCIFNSCNLANQDLTNVSLREVNFETCQLIGINWCNLKRLEYVKYRNCKINFSSFQAMKLKKIEVIGCQAIEADFSDCDLTDGSFSNSHLAGTNFNRAILLNADFRKAKDYLFDLRTTKVKGLKLSMPEAMNLLTVLGAQVEL